MSSIQNWIGLKEVILNYLGLGNKCWLKVNLILWNCPHFRILFESIWPQNNICHSYRCFGKEHFTKTHFVRLYKAKKAILSSKSWLLTKFRNSFWGCRVIKSYSLGSRKWFGTNLDHLGWIRNHLRRIEKWCFKPDFEANLATKNACGMVLYCYG